MALMAITPHIEDLDNFLSHCHRKRYPNRATIIYEGINYETVRNHRYLVQSAATVALKATVRSFGPTYDYTGGWLVRSNWQLVPLRTA